MSKQHTHANHIARRASPFRLTIAAALVLSYNAELAAQEQIDEVLVTGTRAIIQDSIELKRASTTIVDGMSADEIGDIPALSIGEALETLTGSASHRENGGATEISVRGLGPYLGTTVVNGREATNGGGNRAVNFSMFPSEMFNSVAIHKTQSASYIEGAVSGQVHLDSKRPIDYGKERLQLDLKASMHPDDTDNTSDDYGYRGTASYINSWETEELGTMGFSIGVQRADTTNPEQEAGMTSGEGRFEACLLDSFASDAQPVDTSGRCHDGSGGVTNDDIQAIIDSNDDINSVADIPFAYIARDRFYRQNVTDEQRESIFAAFQWQPNDKLDINIDLQMSERDQKEMRNDIKFGATQNNITELVSNPATGVVDSFVTDTDILNFTTDFQRLEEYEGFGFNVAYQVNPDLQVSFDAAYSDTTRTETDVEVRLGATENALEGSRDDFLVYFDNNAAGTDGLSLPTILGSDDGAAGSDASVSDIVNFDINDPAFFNAYDRAQIRARQIVRENTIASFRGDFSLDTQELGLVKNVQGGVRFSSLEYRTFGGNRDTAGVNLFEDEDFDGVADGSGGTDEAKAIIAQAVANCGQTFPESGFLSDVRGSNALININNDVDGGTSNTWATFNHGCLLDTLAVNYGGASGVKLLNGRTTASNDVAEDTLAAYLQANYETELADMPVRGNFGLRVVHSEIDSVGYRSPLSVTEVIDPDTNEVGYVVSADSSATLESTSQSSSYTELLPSVTFIMDVNDEWLFRAGAFKGLSRPDPDAYGNGRNVATNTATDTYETLSEAVTGISATGNPQLEPLTSWNLDVGVEWYPNQDTMVALGVYWKQFKGGFESVYQPEQFNIDGETVSGFVRTTQVSDDKSDLIGAEITATHSFDYLPGFWSGFGVKVSYNYADSNFKYEDGYGGDGVSYNADGEATQLIGILPPAGLFGLSRHTSSSQLYWQQGKFDIQAIYKTRSQYFQQYTRETQNRVRYTADNEVFELRMSYKLNDNIKLTLEGLNLLNEPRIDYRGMDGNVGQTLSYGPRVFAGIQAKF
jgi:iron complex outermembrane recepter protein